MSSSLDLTLPLPLALAVVLGCMVLAGYVVRVRERQRRRLARRQRHGLRRVLAGAIEDRVSAAELRAWLARCRPGTFWSALEALSVRLRYPAWLRLSRALERNRFTRAERRALRDDSPWRRVLAARRLGLLRSERSRRALRQALARGPEPVTVAAARSLARAGDRGALRWLLRHPRALSRRPPAVLAGVLRAFGPGALPDLQRALERGTTSPALERAILEVLGLGEHRDAVAAIERRLVSHDPELRVAAVRALGRLRAVECAASLLHALKDDVWQVRAQAARALGRAGATIAVQALAARLTDRSWWVRRHAAYALRSLGGEGQDALRRVRETSPDPYARDMASEALESIPRLGAA